MIRIAVIDDEPKIRRGIAGLLETSFEGRAVVNCFKSASELIKFSKKEKIDILVTDICMPDMDGLALGNYLKMSYPKLKIVIISGYGNFEYAQAAITLQVCEYLLKPVDPDKLMAVMNKIVEKIEMENLHSPKSEPYISEGQMDRSALIGAMLYGKSTDAFAMASLNDEKIPYWLLISENEHDICQEAANICCQHGRINECQRYYLFSGSIPEVDILMQLFHFKECLAVESYDIQTKSDFKEYPRPEALYDDAQRVRNRLLRIGISGPCYGAEMLHLAYMQAISAIKQEIYDECSGIWQFKGTGVWQFDSEKKAVLILNCIFSGNDFRDNWNMIKEEIRSARPIYPMFEKNMVRMLDVMSGLIENQGISAQLSMLLKRIAENINMYHSLNDLFKDIADVLIQVSKQAQNIQSIRLENRIHKAMEYIQHNYNKDLTLEAVALQADLNSAYFSSYFKKYTGTSFINYLTELRIKKAKEMLKDESRKIGEVAALLGFNDTRYFAKIFKKYVGVTPSEYRNITAKLYD